MSKFRNHTNIRYTAQLFYDVWITLPIEKRLTQPLYTLHDDHPNYINFRKEYISDMDSTGYKTACRLLENFDHFSLLMRSKWFRDAKAEWDKELASKMEAEATDVLRGIMKSTEVKTSERISAAKVVLGKSKTIGKKDGGTTVRGRPTKEEVQGALKSEMEATRDELEDAARIRIVK